MAKKKHSRARKMVIPLATAVPIAATGLALYKNRVSTGDWTNLKTDMTGVDANGNFQWPILLKTYGPIAAGVGISYAATKLGVNRKLGAAKIPLIRI